MRIEKKNREIENKRLTVRILNGAKSVSCFKLSRRASRFNEYFVGHPWAEARHATYGDHK